MTEEAHEDVSQFLQPFVDGELSEQERAEVSAHLEHSEHAREYVRTQAEVRELLRSIPQPSAPPHLEGRIKAALDELGDPTVHANVVSLGGWRQRVMRASVTLLPAAAAAGFLFVFARGDFDSSAGLAANATEIIADSDSAPPLGGTDDTAPTVSASPTPAHLNIHPENLHLPAGIQFVSSQPVPLKPNSTSAPLDLVDALDGQRYVLRIRPAGDGAPSGEPVRIRGKTYWTRAAGTRSPSVEFDHAGQIVTISAPEDAMGSRPPSRAQSQRLLERMLQMASALEIR